MPRALGGGPWATTYPEDSLKEVPGESARGRMQQPTSTWFPEDPYKCARERVLREVNSTPEHSVPRG